MKLLIITQKVNKDDPILGFFHNWIKKFAGHFEQITVICLEKGEYDLPSNVKVLSLGKEEEKSSKFFKKLKYTIRFWSYIWRERKNYQTVFVHMNQEYVLLGGLFWKMMNKKIYMWRNHHAGSILTDIASVFCSKIFCTSKYSYTAKYKKTVLMPVGIDTDLFRIKGEIQRVRNSILFLGRISPVKKPDLLVGVLIRLSKEGVNFMASFYGDSSPKDREYHDLLIKKVSEAGLSDKVKFYPGIPNDKTIDVYNKHEIFVNLSSSGMYDKTIFEAMACGCLVLASNRNLVDVIDVRFVFKEEDIEDLTEKLKNLLFSLNGTEYHNLVKFVVDNHSLNLLSYRLKENIQIK